MMHAASHMVGAICLRTQGVGTATKRARYAKGQKAGPLKGNPCDCHLRASLVCRRGGVYLYSSHTGLYLVVLHISILVLE